MTASASTSPTSRLAAGALLSTAAATVGLAVYQWLELISVREGHETACSVNEVVNCATVWNSPFAHLVHDTIGFPVAGLGVLWGVVAFMAPLLWSLRGRSGGDGSTFVAATKLWAIVGLLSCVTFISASIQAKALCLTCIGTYVLVLAYAGATMLLPGGFFPQSSKVLGAAGWLLVLSGPMVLGLQLPGRRTPSETTTRLQLDAHDPSDFPTLFAQLPERDLITVSFAREKYRSAPKLDASMFPIHARKGNPAAAVKLVEFTDILCGHCAQFEQVVQDLEMLAPEGGLSIEPRYYPLDAECNPEVQYSPRDGVRCYGAKVQICTEQHPKFFKFRHELFENQRQLDQGMILAIAARYGFDTETLNACVKSPETAARLNEDIAYAKRFGIEGTPLVLINDRQALPVPAFLAALVTTGGNAEAPLFSKLPPPPQEPKP